VQLVIVYSLVEDLVPMESTGCAGLPRGLWWCRNHNLDWHFMAVQPKAVFMCKRQKLYCRIPWSHMVPNSNSWIPSSLAVTVVGMFAQLCAIA